MVLGSQAGWSKTSVTLDDVENYLNELPWRQLPQRITMSDNDVETDFMRNHTLITHMQHLAFIQYVMALLQNPEES